MLKYPTKKKGPKPLDVKVRFFKHVKKTDTCWIWTAFCDKKHGMGYGGFKLTNPRKQKWAHRFSWELHYGKIPDGLCILHKCDNPPCVNPKHLKIGTHKDNIRDCFKKGRNGIPPRGELSPRSKFTNEEVRKMRRDSKSWPKGHISVLAKKLSVHPWTIWRIINFKRYVFI